MDNAAELLEALNQIAKEKGISKDVIFEAIESSLVTACKKNYGENQIVRVAIDRHSGQVSVYAVKTIVEEVNDPNAEMSVEEARRISLSLNPGDVVEVTVKPRNFGRIAAQTAKNVVVQKFREAERQVLFDEYAGKEREITTGIVQRRDKRNIIVALGRVDAIMPPSEQIPREIFKPHERVRVYVLEVKQTTKGPQVTVSRTHPELVKRLFEQVVPEVYDGTVEIRSIAREAGSRTKIAVYSRIKDVDPIGACVGQNGMRVNFIVDELKGEKIDIVQWSIDPRAFIKAALAPCVVLQVALNEADRTAKIVVPDNQLSLAIGKEGQNARLAAKLTGWRIDIKSETQAKTTGFITEEELAVVPVIPVVEEFEEYEDEYYDDEYYDDSEMDEIYKEFYETEQPESEQ